MTKNFIRVCQDCQSAYSSDTIGPCLVCGSTSIRREQTAGDNGGFSRISFPIFQCDHCGDEFFSSQSKSCPKCNSPLDLPKSNAERRFEVYGGRFDRICQRLMFVTNLKFADRGQRMEPHRYTHWTADEVIGPLLNLSESLTAGTLRGDWDKPDDDETRSAWRGLEATVNQALSLCQSLKATPPPLLFIANHRSTASAAQLFCESSVLFISTLFSQTPAEAYETASKAQKLLDLAGDSMGKNGEILAQLPTPGEHAPGKSYGTSGASILLELNRESIPLAFPEIQHLTQGDPSLLHPLKDLGVLSGAMQDAERRKQRADSIKSILERADAKNPHWVEDVDLLIDECSSAWSKFMDQCQRLSNELNSNFEPNKLTMHSILDIFTKISEGPVRIYGTMLTIANCVAIGREVKLNEEFLFKYRAGNIIREVLEQASPNILEGVNSFLRNAEAHYDYDIGEHFVSIRHLPPRAKGPNDSRTDTMRHDDVIEQVLVLSEIVLAMALSILQWCIEHASVELRERFRHQWILA